MESAPGNVQEDGHTVDLTANESIRVEKTNATDGSPHIAVVRRGAAPERFVRTLPPPQKPSPLRVLVYFRMGDDDPGAKTRQTTSSPFSLTLCGQPTNQAVVLGQTATFLVACPTGNPPANTTYQCGTTLTLYKSSDGVSWTSVGSLTLSVSDPLLVGLAVTSGSLSSTKTATFDNVSITQS